MKIGNKTKSQVLMSAILLFTLFGFTAAPLAFAAPQSPSPTRTAFESSVLQGGVIDYLGTGILWGFNGILVGIGSLAAGLVDISAVIFDASIEFSLSTLRENEAIRAGWTISRDLANIFFVLIILSIAIATILRVESYALKSLLPKLIVIALVINFSLVIGYTIIDATNLLGLQFYEAIIDKNSSNPKSVSSAILAGTKLSNVFNTELPKDTVSAQLSQVGKGVAVTIGAAAAIGTCLWLLPACGWGAFIAAVAGGGGLGAIGWSAITGNNISSAIEFFLLAGSTIIFLVAVLFVLIAGAVFLIMRSIMLVFLLVLAPIAFISYALPITERKLWQPWWETFINQAMFLPAFMFLLYVSISWLNQIGKDVATGVIVYNPPAAMAVVTGTLMVTVSFLLARKMGILFAESVIKYAAVSRQFLTGAVSGFALRNTLGRVGKRLEAAGVDKAFTRVSPTAGLYAKRSVDWLKTRGEAQTQAEEQAALGMALPESQRGAYFARLNLAGKEAMLRKMSPDERARFMDTLSPEQRQSAEQIARSPLFAPKERISTDLAAFRRLTPEERRARFGELDEASQAELLAGMQPEQQAEFISGLSPADQARANALMASPRFTNEDRRKLELARYNRLTPEERKAGFGQLSQENKTEVLAGMKSAEERAEFVSSLSPSGQTSAANIITTSPRFKEEEKQRFRAAQFARQTEDAQRLAFSTQFNEEEKAAWLRGKSDEEKAKFLAGFDQSPPAALPPAQAALWSGAKGEAEKIIKTKFSPQEQRSYELAKFNQLTPQAKRTQLGAWLTPSTPAAPNPAHNPEYAGEILHGLAPKDQAELVANLGAAERGEAEKIISTSARFTDRDRQNFRVAKATRGTEPEQIAAFIAPSFTDDEREAFLKGLDVEKRVRFARKLPPGASGQDLARNIMMSSRFTAGEQQEYLKVERREEMRDVERAGGKISEYVAGKIPPTATPAEKARLEAAYFKSSEDRQKLLWLEEAHSSQADVKRYRELVEKELNPEEQEKFHRETLRRASTPAVSGYIESLPTTQAPNVVRHLSSAQQAELYTERIENITKRNIIEETVRKLSADAQKDFHISLAAQISQKTSQELAKAFGNLPAETQRTIAQRYPQKLASAVDSADTPTKARMAAIAIKQGIRRDQLAQIVKTDSLRDVGFVKELLKPGNVSSVQEILKLTERAPRAQALGETVGAMIADKVKASPEEEASREWRAERVAEIMEEQNNRKVAQEIRDGLKEGSPYRNLVDELLAGVKLKKQT